MLLLYNSPCALRFKVRVFCNSEKSALSTLDLQNQKLEMEIKVEDLKKDSVKGDIIISCQERLVAKQL